MLSEPGDDTDLMPIFDSFPPIDRANTEKPGLVSEFPILSREWRISEVHPLAYDYCAIADCHFSVPNLRRVIRAGTQLMNAFGSFNADARHVQEIQIRKQHDARVYLE